jgi:hypothetical protein
MARGLRRREASPRRPINKAYGKEGFVDGETATPQITVSIGTLTRVYHAFVTTAPATIDAPATVTLYAATVSDVAGMAADPDALDTARASTPARLVLVDATELAWQRRRCREARHPLAPTDPILVGRKTLQHWLWHRLTASIDALETAGAQA